MFLKNCIADLSFKFVQICNGVIQKSIQFYLQNYVFFLQKEF